MLLVVGLGFNIVVGSKEGETQCDDGLAIREVEDKEGSSNKDGNDKDGMLSSSNDISATHSSFIRVSCSFAQDVFGNKGGGDVNEK